MGFRFQVSSSRNKVYLEGHGDLESRSIRGIIGAIVCLVGDINLITKSP